jgi:diguanylate cyclase (GGDEF)-like protein/PAS domain S-box-containing protein
MEIWSRISPDDAWRALFEASPWALLLVDPAVGSVVLANASAERRYGYGRKLMEGLELNALVDPGETGAIKRLSRPTRGFMSAGRHRRRDGGAFPARVHVAEIAGRNGSVLLVTVLDSSETDLFDSASGLPDPRLFVDRLDQSIVHAHRAASGLGVCLVLFPRLEQLLEDLQTDGARRLLHDIGDRLRANLRESDTVARVGSAEFAIIIEGVADRNAITEVLRKVTDDFAYEFTVGDEELVLEPRVGVSSYPHDGHEADMLLENAALAARDASSEGLDRIRFFSGS